MQESVKRSGRLPDSHGVEPIDEAAHIPLRAGREVLRADVAAVPLATTLAALHQGECSGRLDFSYAGHRKVVWLRRGEVVFASSNAMVDRLGECLLRAGLLEIGQLEQAERVHRPPARFGRALVECGFLTPRQLWNAVRHQVEEIVRSLFCYPGGELSFRVDVAESDNVVRLALETGRLIEEGLQRRREIQRFLELLRDPRARLVRGPAFRGGLASEERQLVEAVGEGAHFSELTARLGIQDEAAARSVQLLRLVGALRLARGDDETPRTLEPAGELTPQLESRCKEITALVDALVAAGSEGPEPGGQEPAAEEILDRAVADLARRNPALGAVTLREAGSLDRWALRVLALPGGSDPIEDVLAEITSYLLFAIRNHPGIRDPESLIGSSRG